MTDHIYDRLGSHADSGLQPSDRIPESAIDQGLDACSRLQRAQARYAAKSAITRGQLILPSSLTTYLSRKQAISNGPTITVRGGLWL